MYQSAQLVGHRRGGIFWVGGAAGVPRKGPPEFVEGTQPNFMLLIFFFFLRKQK